MFLGPTESRLMELAWRHGRLTVKQALMLLGTEKGTPAYSTISTILSRLTERGILRAEKQGRYFVYTPVPTRAEFVRLRVAQVRDCLTRNFRTK